MEHMAVIFFNHSKVVGNFAKNANLSGILSTQILKAIGYEARRGCF